MNGMQKLIRLGGLLILVSMALFPPWKLSYTTGLTGEAKSRSVGYFALWNPPADEVSEDEKDGRYQIDLVRLGVQFAGMLALMNGGIYFLRRKAMET